MATSRKCGWCEEVGHQKRNCETYHSTRALVWKGTIARRAGLLERMAKMGVGNGAIIHIEERHDGADVKVPYMVLDNEEQVSLWSFFSFKNVKYSKRVMALETDMFSYDSVQIKLFSLKESRQLVRYLNLKELANGGSTSSYLGWSSFTILEPSHDPHEINAELLKKDIWCHKRLATSLEIDQRPYNPLMIESELKL